MCPSDHGMAEGLGTGADKQMADELYRLGRELLGQGLFSQAAFHFRKALLVAGRFAEAAHGLGCCLNELRHFEEALAVYDELLKEGSARPEVWNNRGNALLELGRLEEASGSYARAVELEPSLHDARIALATCHQALERYDAALDACNYVLAADPHHAEAHWNRGLLLLLQGEYRQGWREYEWRWRKRRFTSPRREFSQPRWTGEAAAGKTILIHAEQGFGDTLQFCRYIPLVVERGLRVVFACHPPLVSLMECLPCQVVAFGQPLPAFDLHVPLLSLPLIFDTTLETIPRVVPYLKAPPNRFPDQIREGGVSRDLRVGLCWAGKQYPDPRRSCPPEVLAPLAACGGIAWHSLQMERGGELPFPAVELEGSIRDFADTAAHVARLDLVITIDTALAHLAGSLGVPTWVMLPRAPDWRWLLERGNCPWYPTMRLFRQKEPGGWADVVARIVAALAAVCP